MEKVQSSSQLNIILWLKSALLQFVCLIASAGISLTAPILFILPYKYRYYYITLFSRICIFAAKWLCGIEYIVTGRENIPDFPCVVVSNHQSAWETLFYQCLLGPQTWLLKRELLMIPFFGWGLAMLKPIAIKRGKTNNLNYFIEMAQKRLDEGLSVIVFPEGTRTEPGNLNKRYSKGA